MKPILFLHAGFHKTGTSAIQRAASSNRRLLKRHGMFYPRLWPASFRPVDAHHFLAQAVAGHGRFVTGPQAKQLVERWCKAAARRRLAVLLSSEAICRLSLQDGGEAVSRQEAYLERLKSLLSGFEVTPVLVIRRQDEFVRSLYQEHVLAGTGESSRTDFREFLADRAVGKARFLEVLRLFDKVFGTPRVLLYEDLVESGFPGSFFGALGIERLAGEKSQVVRPSLTIAETHVKCLLNRWVSNRIANRLLLLWLRTPRVRHELAQQAANWSSLWPSAQVRQEFLGRFSVENQQLARKFLPERERLFTEWIPDDVSSQYPEEDEIWSLARALSRYHRRLLHLAIGRAGLQALLSGVANEDSA